MMSDGGEEDGTSFSERAWVTNPDDWLSSGDIDIDIDEDAKVRTVEFDAEPDEPITATFTVESGGLHETELGKEAFEGGMERKLATDLDEIIFESEEVEIEPPPDFLPPDVSPDVVEELSVDEENAERLLKVIYQKLNEFQKEYGDLPERLVLGLPQFKAVESYVREMEDESVERRLPVDEVIVVPGPQIHCVYDPYKMVEEDLEDE